MRSSAIIQMLETYGEKVFSGVWSSWRIKQPRSHSIPKLGLLRKFSTWQYHPHSTWLSTQAQVALMVFVETTSFLHLPTTSRRRMSNILSRPFPMWFTQFFLNCLFEILWVLRSRISWNLLVLLWCSTTSLKKYKIKKNG